MTKSHISKQKLRFPSPNGDYLI